MMSRGILRLSSRARQISFFRNTFEGRTSRPVSRVTRAQNFIRYERCVLPFCKCFLPKSSNVSNKVTRNRAFCVTCTQSYTSRWGWGFRKDMKHVKTKLLIVEKKISMKMNSDLHSHFGQALSVEEDREGK